jgi:hypothetical protein
MFCPNCGKSEQLENTYCRQCGVFLPDFTKQGKRRISPEEHIKSNIVLDIMTIVAALTLSILLFVSFFGQNNTPALIYVTAGFLIAISAWQAQTLWRTFQLKKHFRERKGEISEGQKQDNEKALHSFPTKPLLNEADFSNPVPPSVAENTTKKLKQKVARKSS